MLVSEAIARVDELKPNEYALKEKVRWLSELDGKILKEIVIGGTFKDGDNNIGSQTDSPFKDYWGDWFENTHFTEDGGGYQTEYLNDRLLVSFPYDSMYMSWLTAQVEYANGEYTKYNNDITRFNEDYKQFVMYLRRRFESRQSRMNYRGTINGKEWSPLDL